MSAIDSTEPRTDAYRNLVQQIADFTHTDSTLCSNAVESIVSFYDNHTCEQLATNLLLFLKDGQENRAIVHQFRVYVRQP